MTGSPASGPSSNPSTEAARVLLQALATLGVESVVLAPGSRSAPLAYAVAEAARGDARATGAPRLDVHVRIDERSAGFLAVGLSKGARSAGRSGLVAVVTTSGTAVANLHPATLEAHHSGLPLLLLTADRPHELRGTGANQTTEQVGLLGPVRLMLDVPAPTGRPGEARDQRHLAARAVAAALGSRTGDPGPVHLNLAFREPLVPDDAPWPPPSREGLPWVPGRRATGPLASAPVTALLTAAGLSAVGGPPEPRPCPEPRLHRGDRPDTTGNPHGEVSAGAVPTSAVPLDTPATVVVAGDGAGPQARRIAEVNGWPLLAEPSSGARGGPNAIPGYRLLLADERLGGAVRRAVVLGRPTLSRPVQELLARGDVETLIIAPHGGAWPDAARAADLVLTEVPPGLLDGTLASVAHGWLLTWQRAGAAALDALHAQAEAGPLTGPAVAAEVAVATEAGGPAQTADVRSAGRGAVLVVGSSNPVRDLDLVANWQEPPVILANRGLAGIDGTLATASGVALALGVPVRAYVGDLTFLHDVGSLLVGSLERRPDLHVVVANDDGGSIFATLEHGDARHAEVFERVFGTPHGADLGALCAGYGVRHQVVHDASALRAALAAPVTGVSVTEVRLGRAGRRDEAVRLGAAVQRAVSAALA